MIQNGQMSRAEGLELVQKYDAEFPKTYHAEHLDYLGLSEAEFSDIVDKHRDLEIWQNTGNAWDLKHPPE